MNNFEVLKDEVSKLIQNSLSDNEQSVLKFINTILLKFESNLRVRKNMSIASFQFLLLNSATPEEFKNYLNRLDINKQYEIMDLKELNDSIEFNEEFGEGFGCANRTYKKFLDSRIQFNDNLYVIEYPEN